MYTGKTRPQTERPMRVETITIKLHRKTDIVIVRDDYFPFYYGGNKARKSALLLPYLEKLKHDAIVTTGGIQSNHCRVVALACAQRGWKCKLILHGSKKEFVNEKGNALLMRLAGADVSFVEPQEIGPAMDKAMIELSEKGFSPYYLHGGGHNKYGVQAFEDAVQELQQAINPKDIPDHIFLASGTGSTQAGIIVGCEKVRWRNTKVKGISVARDKTRGVEAISEAIGFVFPYPDRFSHNIHFYDDFLFGGYGIKDPQILSTIDDVASKTGIILDSTYTGKAFWGMMEIMRQEKLKGNILFWHTGGLLNLMA